jgi:hypothetical protein
MMVIETKISWFKSIKNIVAKEEICSSGATFSFATMFTNHRLPWQT